MNVFQHRLSLLLAMLCVALMAGNAALLWSNRATQEQLSERALKAQELAAQDAVYREALRLLADGAVRGNDADLRALLQRLGIGAADPGAGARP
jgi:hypothetical protein